jgi:hypothetical protein
LILNGKNKNIKSNLYFYFIYIFIFYPMGYYQECVAPFGVVVHDRRNSSDMRNLACRLDEFDTFGKPD